VPTYRAEQLRKGVCKELELCSAVGRAGGTMTGDEEHEAVASFLPGFFIKRHAALHLKWVGFVSKKKCGFFFSRSGGLIFSRRVLRH